MPLELYEIKTIGEPAGAVLVADGCGGVRAELPPGGGGATPLGESIYCEQCSSYIQPGQTDAFRGRAGWFCYYCHSGMTPEAIAAEVGLDAGIIQQLSGTAELRRELEQFVETQLEAQRRALEARFVAPRKTMDVVRFEGEIDLPKIEDAPPMVTWFQIRLSDGSLDPLSVCVSLEGLLAAIESMRLDRTQTYTIVQVAGEAPGGACEILEGLEYGFDGRGRLRPERELAAARIADDPDY